MDILSPSGESHAGGAETLSNNAPIEPTSAWRVVRRDWRVSIPLTFLGLLTALAIAAPVLAPYDPYEIGVGPSLAPPSANHLLGTDALGRDSLSRIMFGTRISLGAAAIVSFSAVLIGTSLGLVSGYSRRRVDFIIGRILDLLLTFEGLLLALVLATLMRPSLRTVVIALTVVYVPVTARFIRSAVAREMGREYVTAARVAGASPLRIMLRHVLPNIVSHVLVIASLIMSFAVLAEASLSFIGLGVQPPAASWGRTLAENRFYLTTVPELVIFPGIAIMLLVLSLNLLGDGLRDLLDPYHRSTTEMLHSGV